MDVFNNMLGTQKAPESSIHLTIISVTELAYPARYAETPLFVRMTHGPKEYTTTERYVHDEHGALWEEDFSIVVSPGHDILALDVCCILNGEEKTIGGVPLPLEQIMPEEQELMSGVFDAENKHAGVLRILTSWPESARPTSPTAATRAARRSARSSEAVKTLRAPHFSCVRFAASYARSARGAPSASGGARRLRRDSLLIAPT